MFLKSPMHIKAAFNWTKIVILWNITTSNNRSVYIYCKIVIYFFKRISYYDQCWKQLCCL